MSRITTKQKRELNSLLKKKDRSLLALMIPLAIWLYFIVCWIVNAFMFFNCDFDGPWKDEIIHGVGLLGPISGITVWF